MKSRIGISLAAAVLAMVGVNVAQATIMIKPVGVTVSVGGYSGNPWDGNPLCTINGSGLSDGTIVETGDTVPVTMPTHAGYTDVRDPPDGTGGNSVITHNTSGDGDTGNLIWVLDLGAKYDLTKLVYWNWYRDGNYPTMGLTLSTSAINGSFSNPSILTMAGANSPSPEVFSITGSGVQYVQLSNWKASSSGAWMGTMEIRFEGETGGQVPEPGTWLLLGGSLLGLCVGGFKRIRSKLSV